MELTACNASAEKDCSRLSPIGRVAGTAQDHIQETQDGKTG